MLITVSATVEHGQEISAVQQQLPLTHVICKHVSNAKECALQPDIVP